MSGEEKVFLCIASSKKFLSTDEIFQGNLILTPQAHGLTTFKICLINNHWKVINQLIIVRKMTN